MRSEGRHRGGPDSIAFHPEDHSALTMSRAAVYNLSYRGANT